jgi:hypothetical protein
MRHPRAARRLASFARRMRTRVAPTRLILSSQIQRAPAPGLAFVTGSHSRDTGIQVNLGNSTELKANSFSGDVSRFRTKFLQYSRGVSFGKTSRDTDVSNLLRSASESQVEAFSGEVRKLRACSGDAHALSGAFERSATRQCT